MSSRELLKVERAAELVAAAMQARDAAIFEARASGESLRAIASAAGVSYETVRLIVGPAKGSA